MGYHLSVITLYKQHHGKTHVSCALHGLDLVHGLVLLAACVVHVLPVPPACPDLFVVAGVVRSIRGLQWKWTCTCMSDLLLLSQASYVGSLVHGPMRFTVLCSDSSVCLFSLPENVSRPTLLTSIAGFWREIWDSRFGGSPKNGNPRGGYAWRAWQQGSKRGSCAFPVTVQRSCMPGHSLPT